MEDTIAIRLLPHEEFYRLSAIIEAENLPKGNSEVLVLEQGEKIICAMAFHHILAVGITYTAPEWRGNAALPLKMMGVSIEQMMKDRGEPLFLPIADDESPALAKQFGCVKIGELYRKDFN